MVPVLLALLYRTHTCVRRYSERRSVMYLNRSSQGGLSSTQEMDFLRITSTLAWFRVTSLLVISVYSNNLTITDVYYLTLTCVFVIYHDFVLTSFLCDIVLNLKNSCQWHYSVNKVRRIKKFPVGTRFSAPSRPALGPTQPPVKRVPGLSRA